MNDERIHTSIPATTVFSVLPFVTALLSMVYVYGFQYSNGLPIMPLMTVGDFVAAALPWLLPSSLFLGACAIAGMVTARVETSGGLQSPNEVGSRVRRLTSSGTFGLCLLGLVFLLIDSSSHSVSYRSFVMFVFAAYVAVPEFGHNSRFVQEWFGFFGQRGIRLMFFLPLALAYAFASGLDHGKSGNRLLVGGEKCVILLDGERTALGVVSFKAGSFVVFHEEVQGGTQAVLIPERDILEVRKPVGFDPAVADDDTGVIEGQEPKQTK